MCSRDVSCVLVCHVCWRPFSLGLTPKCLCAAGCAPHGRAHWNQSQIYCCLSSAVPPAIPERQSGLGCVFPCSLISPSFAFSLLHRDRTTEEPRFSTRGWSYFIYLCVIKCRMHNVIVFGNSCIIFLKKVYREYRNACCFSFRIYKIECIFLYLSTLMYFFLFSK